MIYYFTFVFREGSKSTPSHTYAEFRLKTYAQIAFRFFRNAFGVDPSAFIVIRRILLLHLIFIFFLVINLWQRSSRIAQSRCEWFDILYHCRRHVHHQNCLEKRSTISSQSSSGLLYEFNTESVYTSTEILRTFLLSKCQSKYSFCDYE